MSRRHGFGLGAGLDEDLARALASRCEALGYSSIWSDDHVAASGLRTLAAFAQGSEGLELGVGALELDRHRPAEIAAEIEALGLERDRLWLGLGAGLVERPLTVMEEALGELRERLEGIRLVLAGALGPELLELAGRSYDGVLLEWTTPTAASAARVHLEAGAREADRPTPPVLGYVRAAVGADAETRLARDEGFFRELHAGYRAHFERLGEPPGSLGVQSERPEEIGPALAEYEGALDHLIVRALARIRLGTIDRLARAAAP